MSSAVDVISEDRSRTAGELRPLVAIVIAVATIFLVLFELPVFVTVTQGYVEYPIGIDYSPAYGARVGYVSDPGLLGDGTALILRARHGHHGLEIKELSRDDAMARLLLSERRPIGVAETHWHAPGSGAAALDIAVPLFSRNDLLGIVFYGRHRNGTTIDPEERDLLTRLCNAAAVAYEAVALAQARKELAVLRGS